jgi:hypothetical protein
MAQHKRPDKRNIACHIDHLRQDPEAEDVLAYLSIVWTGGRPEDDSEAVPDFEGVCSRKRPRSVRVDRVGG